MKKLFALLLAVLMVFGMCACAETDIDDDYDNTPPSIPDGVINAPDRVNVDFYPLDTDITLRVLFNEDGKGDTDASDLWERVTGVKVENLKWNNQQMLNALAASDIPDAIVMPWEFEKNMVYEFGVGGKFLDFSKYLEKMPNLSALIREYPEIMDVCGYPGGAMYSLPKVGWSNTYQSNLLYIREDLLEKMGMTEAPQTTDAFLQFIKDAQAKFSKEDPEFVAFMPQQSTYMNWTGNNTIASTFFPSFGPLIETGLTVNADDEVVLGAATEQYRYYLEFMHDIWTSGAFETEVYTMDSSAGRATIQNGHCVVSIGTHAPKTYFPDGKEHAVVMAPLTSRYQGTKQWMKTPLINYRGCVASAAVAEDPEKLEVLLAWLDSFYATEDNPLYKDDKTMVYGYSITKGVVGEHWNFDTEAGTWESTGKEFSNYSDALYSGNNILIPLTSLTVKGTGTNENLLPYAKPVSGLNNAVLKEDDQDTFNDLWADLEKFISTKHAEFITGREDLETGWDAYLNELNRMGLEEVLEIYQRVYNGTNS
ncbi:MAG: hypothetical protein E7447_04425 [Ruminococcaceae bacterium]|nr:hypothetical protein [Oscillospiraceae bacterium]